MMSFVLLLGIGVYATANHPSAAFRSRRFNPFGVASWSL
jgi:hypothetical protein